MKKLIFIFLLLTPRLFADFGDDLGSIAGEVWQDIKNIGIDLGNVTPSLALNVKSVATGDLSEASFEAGIEDAIMTGVTTFTNISDQYDHINQTLLKTKIGNVELFPIWNAIHQYGAPAFEKYINQNTGGFGALAMDIVFMVATGGAIYISPTLNPLKADVSYQEATSGVFSNTPPTESTEDAPLVAFHAIKYSCQDANKQNLATDNVLNATIKIDIKGKNGVTNKQFKTKAFAFKYGDNIKVFVNPKAGTANIYRYTTPDSMLPPACASNELPGFTAEICGCNTANKSTLPGDISCYT